MADPVTIWTLDWVPETPRGFVRDLRLRWACEEAGLPYRIATVAFDDRETNHLDRQPFGQVPMLEDGDLRLFESGACVIHLARKGGKLIPADPKGEIEVLQWIMAALNAVTEWLFGFSLYDAGANVLRTLVDGIKSMANVPVEAVKGVVQRVRNLLPFSPAKDGPLRDLHQIRLIETIADTVNPSPLVDAATRATSQTADVLRSTAPMVSLPVSLTLSGSPLVDALPGLLQGFNVSQAAPLVSVALDARPATPPPERIRGDDRSPPDRDPPPPEMHVQIIVKGDATEQTVERLDAWVRDNGELLYSAVRRQAQIEQRGAFE